MSAKKKIQIDEQEYEIDPANNHIGHIPNTKKEKKDRLKIMLNNKLYERWRRIPKKIATLERTIIFELIDTL